MIAKGLRISDIKNGKCISLSELLLNIPNPDQLNWSLLWFDVRSIDSEGRFISELTEKINSSKKSLNFAFTELLVLSKKIFQEIEILLVGCKNKKNLHRYKKDEEMYETCDVVMEMIDGGFWEIFSKNETFLNQLAKNYKEVEILASDFQTKK